MDKSLLNDYTGLRANNFPDWENSNYKVNWADIQKTTDLVKWTDALNLSDEQK